MTIKQTFLKNLEDTMYCFDKEFTGEIGRNCIILKGTTRGNQRTYRIFTNGALVIEREKDNGENERKRANTEIARN